VGCEERNVENHKCWFEEDEEDYNETEDEENNSETEKHARTCFYDSDLNRCRSSCAENYEPDKDEEFCVMKPCALRVVCSLYIFVY
jgi:hypothetical protein